jgi:hypothetical protein
LPGRADIRKPDYSCLVAKNRPNGTGMTNWQFRSHTNKALRAGMLRWPASNVYAVSNSSRRLAEAAAESMINQPSQKQLWRTLTGAGRD